MDSFSTDHRVAQARRFRFIFLVLTLLFALPVWGVAQSGTLTGRVLDVSNGDPIPTANVFVPHSTIGTSTDVKGRFILENIPYGSYDIVVSIIGFESRSANFSLSPNKADHRLVVKLKEKTIALDQVTVVDKENRGWKKQFKEFKKHFLGETPNAKETEILNPFVLDFNKVGQDLVATASEPLRIENRGLGYQVTYVLDQFRWDPIRKQLRYSGRPLFTELTPENEAEALRWEEYRRRAYEGSKRHFLRSLQGGELFDLGYVVHHDDRVDAPFKVATQMGLRNIELDDILESNADLPYRWLQFSNYLRITYVKRSIKRLDGQRKDRRPSTQVSWIKLATGSTILDADGAARPHDSIHSFGYFWSQRVADALPREYGRTTQEIE